MQTCAKERARTDTCPCSQVRGHLFKFLHNGLRTHPHLRDELLLARSLEEMASVSNRLEAAGWEQPNFHHPSGGERLEF